MPICDFFTPLKEVIPMLPIDRIGFSIQKVFI